MMYQMLNLTVAASISCNIFIQFIDSTHEQRQAVKPVLFIETVGRRHVKKPIYDCKTFS